ncbi:MAG: hypothetical protein AAGA46_03325 [Cyanobacteria bacterium P01_F01_bin.13]
MEQEDSVPSVGVIPSTKQAESDRLAEMKRNWARWILEKIRSNPDNLELHRIVARQQKAIDILVKENKELRQDIVFLKSENSLRKTESEEYRQWELETYNHVASVDEKAERLSELTTVLFTIVELLHVPLPLLERMGKGLLWFTAKVGAMEKRKRSRVDGVELNELLK